MIRIGLSTSCAFPRGVEAAFRLASTAGYDGVEVMVTNDPITRDADRLLELSARYSMPILSIHAPVLLLTTWVWSRDPRVKLERSADLARAVGASTVVVHPPFRWQVGYARDFVRIVREVSERDGVEIAVENMFPWRIAGRALQMYSPSPDPTSMAVDAMTLDFSHAALTGLDSLELASRMGSRLRHVHLCDGSGSLDDGTVLDEHLVPGRGNQPVAEVLQLLAATGWQGSVVAEVITRKARSDEQRLELLTETLAFAREHLGQTVAATEGPARRASRLARLAGGLRRRAAARD